MTTELHECNAHAAICGNCNRSWCAKCDPGPSALCPFCHGRGWSDAELDIDPEPMPSPTHADVTKARERAIERGTAALELQDEPELPEALTDMLTDLMHVRGPEAVRKALDMAEEHFRAESSGEHAEAHQFDVVFTYNACMSDALEAIRLARAVIAGGDGGWIEVHRDGEPLGDCCWADPQSRTDEFWSDES